MKRISLTIITTAFLLSSCGKLLDQYPHSAVNPENVTGKDIPAMRAGMYNCVQNLPGTCSYMIFDLLGGDLTQKGRTPEEMAAKILDPQNPLIASQWKGYYNALYQVNNMIVAAGRFPEDALARKALGEAHYFRAWIFSCLATRWGDVPLIEHNAMGKTARTSLSEIWTFINKELEQAKRLLETSESCHYVSRNAVKALKARVLLYQDMKIEAAQIAEEIIRSQACALEDFSIIFNSGHPSGKETIFAFLNKDSTESSINLAECYAGGGPFKGEERLCLTGDIVKLFEDIDLRKANSIISADGMDGIHKYPGRQDSRDPFIVSRLGEMYLISAEGQGFPEGLLRLNDLRKKRGLPPVMVSNEEDFIDMILTERRLELLGENHLYYDYVRLGKASVLGLQEHQEVLPIPAEILLTEKHLAQNPGY